MAMFYGFSHEEMTKMPEHVFQEYWLAITQIEAQEMLKAMDVQDWPNTKAHKREDKRRKLYDEAYPMREVGKVLTLSELENKLKG